MTWDWWTIPVVGAFVILLGAALNAALSRRVTRRSLTLEIRIGAEDTHMAVSDRSVALCCSNEVIVDAGRRRVVAIPGLPPKSPTEGVSGERVHLVKDAATLPPQAAERLWGMYLAACCLELRCRIGTHQVYLVGQTQLDTGSESTDRIVERALAGPWLDGFGHFRLRNCNS